MNTSVLTLTVSEFANQNRDKEYYYNSIYGRIKTRIIGFDSGAELEDHSNTSDVYAIEVLNPYSSTVGLDGKPLTTSEIVRIDDLEEIE